MRSILKDDLVWVLGLVLLVGLTQPALKFLERKASVPFLQTIQDGPPANGTVFEIVDDSSKTMPKPPADSLSYFKMTLPDIDNQISGWKNFQEQLKTEFSKAQGKIELYESMKKQLITPSAKDTTAVDSTKARKPTKKK